MGAHAKRIQRTSLADDLADRVVQLIRAEGYTTGDRLPAIMEMARMFGVGHPTVREALRKLETVGLVEIKHGSGVYVGQGQETFFLSNPVFGGDVSRKLMLDLIEARTPIEVRAATLAATHATPEQLEHMQALLDRAEATLGDGDALSSINMSFHRVIAEASGNSILPQLQEVMTKLFYREQRKILDIYGSRERDHAEHVSLLEALRARNPGLAMRRMQAHLDGVRDTLLSWNPDEDQLFT